MIRLSHESRVLRVTLAYAEKRNALSESMCRELLKALDDAWNDDQVGCILLDAEGPVFCAGMDLEEASAPDAATRTELHERIFTSGLNAPKPIVAAVQGPALGGGLGLVANAHVVLAAQGTQFGLTEIRLGMWPLVIWRAMSSALGERRTLELALTGRIFGAAEGQQFGLVHEICPSFELEDRASATAQRIADSSPVAIGRGLAYWNESRNLDDKAAGEVARRLRNEIFALGDFAEGIRAFREKRRPEWPSLIKTD